MLANKPELPMLTIEETIVEAPEDTDAIENEIAAEDNEATESNSSENVAAKQQPVADTANPAEELFERFGKYSSAGEPRFVDHMGVRIDLSEIDLLVETEIAAGTIKSRKDIHSFRLKALDKKAVQIREGLAQQNGRSRRPTSTR